MQTCKCDNCIRGPHEKVKMLPKTEVVKKVLESQSAVYMPYLVELRKHYPSLRDDELLAFLFIGQQQELADATQERNDLKATWEHDHELVGKYMADAEKAEQELAAVRKKARDRRRFQA